MNPIQEAVKEWYGERCPDFEPECVVCQAYLGLDRLDDVLEWVIDYDESLPNRYGNKTIDIVETAKKFVDKTGTHKWTLYRR